MNRTLVIDNGSGFMKAGFSNEIAPRVVYPTCVGRYALLEQTTSGKTVVGDQALQRRGIYKTDYPIKQGIVNNWDDMKVLWNHTIYKELAVSPEEHSFLLSDSPSSPKSNRVKMSEIMFENIHTPYLYIANEAVLALYASSPKLSGIVINSGHDITHTVPIYEGYTVTHAVHKLDFGGRHFTTFLMKLLTERGFSFTTIENMIAEDIKKELTYVALDFVQELQIAASTSSLEMNYELPDGQIISIENERFRCTEALFQPAFLGKEIGGIHELAYDSIMKCDSDMRDNLYGNIILAGGNTNFTGIADRVQKEIIDLAPPVKVKVIAPPERSLTTWIGGAIIASLSTFSKMCVSKEEYDEYGSSIINIKCF